MKRDFIYIFLCLGALLFSACISTGNDKKTEVLIPTDTEIPNSVNAPVVDTDEEHLIILAESLKTDVVSFIQLSPDSKIELLARKGSDGSVKIALGTCQSCNGSPYAYYTQEENFLICNNCGQAFPIEVLDQPGGGCHPIMIDESIISPVKGGISLDIKGLKEYEPLFAKVENH